MFHVHRAERADGLVAALGAVVSSPLDDPLQAEVVAVPTRGVERWLTQRLSAVLGVSPGRADGVCANVEFPFPGRLVNGAVASALEIEREADPWLAARSVWPLVELVQASLGEPWMASLAAHLGGAGTDGDASRRTRRLSTVRHIADLYDRYAVHRPAMLRDWANGADGRWQAELWRRLRARLGVPSPAERLEEACVRLRGDATIVDLPARISLFGLTRLPASYLDVLHALAGHRDVHLFLLHPSAALWARVASVTGDRPPIVLRDEDDTAALPRNPLLASWAEDAREMQLVLAAHAGEMVVHDHVVVADRRVTLLARIQADVRGDRAPPGPPLPGVADERMTLEPTDRSVQVHACHGRARQVEVVRDCVLRLLADDPTLEPRDIVVMCPDIETFAPLIHATFGSGIVGDDEDDLLQESGRRIDLRVRLADRSLRQTNPVLGVVAQLLDLADGRLTASQVLDLAGRAPVRRRFRFDDDELARVAQWARESGVRWGLTAAQRARYRLDVVPANTWEAGWDRVLLGVAMAEEGQRLLGGVLPLDDVGSSEIDLAGRFAEFLERLEAAVDAFACPLALDEWAAAIAAAADSLTDAPGQSAWQRLQLGRLLEDLVAEGTTAGAVTETELTLPEVRALLADRLRGQPTRASFRTGHLTVCTLVPMRSVPHRVVCLMGLDDGVFPRQTARDGDDLLLAEPHVGDRDARSEDRQLLLDAVLAATDHLVITYAARDERTNLRRPPAVPVGERFDVVDRTVRLADAGGAAPARERVVVEHPLQPFDVRNFEGGVLVPEGPWSFDRVALEGARALQGDRDLPPPFLARPLDPVPEQVIELERLVAFVQHPVRAFLRQRLGLGGIVRDDDPNDALSVELNALESWGVAERLLEARLAGATMEAAVAAETARGELPPQSLADRALDYVRPIVEQLVAAAAEFLPPGQATASVAVRVPLAGGRTLVGTVPGVRDGVVTAVTYSRLKPWRRLAAWVYLLALAAAQPETTRAAATVGRLRAGGPKICDVTVARVRLPEDPEARRADALLHLAVLVDLFDRGIREPLPLYCETSAAYAAAVAAGKDGERAAGNAWTSARWQSEDVEPEHRLVLGGKQAIDELFEEAARPDEQGEGWPLDEPSRLGRYARRLWGGLLAREELIDR
jgi:exodeoxyribonuclease V gamma subunit